MAEVQRKVVTPPNEEIKGTAGNRKNGSFAQPKSASPAHPPNDPHQGGDHRKNGFMSLAGQANPINPPNHRFTPHRMAQPQSANKPGKGAIPIRPFNNAGMPNLSHILKDNIKK